MKRITAVIGMAVIGIAAFVGLSKLSSVMDQPKGFDPATVPDVAEYTTGVSKDTVVATVAGSPIYAEDFLYWLGYAAEMAHYDAINQDLPLDWTIEEDGKVLADLVKEQALESAKLYALVQVKADELGCGLDEQTLTDFDTSFEALKEQMGGEAAMGKQLLQMATTEDAFKRINQAPFLYDNLQSQVEIEPVTLDELNAYVETSDMLRAKHILLATKDLTTGEAYDEAQKAEQLALAEDLVDQLSKSEEPLVLFDELMFKYSQDSGLFSYPNGYDFTANEMVAEFEEATRALEYEGISGVVESSFGYHIILRLDPVDAALEAQFNNARVQAAMDTLISQWMEENAVEATEAYDSIDVPTFYDNLQGLREKITLADAAAAE